MKTTTQKGFKRLPEMPKDKPTKVTYNGKQYDVSQENNGMYLDGEMVYYLGKNGRSVFHGSHCVGYIDFPELKFIEGEFCK